MKDDREITGSRPSDGGPARHGAGGDAVTFVIVLRLEPAGKGSEPEWRWSVRSVETGATGHFRRIADVLAYIAAMSGNAGPR